jgi:hypothetical protein
LYYICQHYPEQPIPIREAGWTLKAGIGGSCPIVWQLGEWVVTDDEGDHVTVANSVTGFQWEGYCSWTGTNGCGGWMETTPTSPKGSPSPSPLANVTPSPSR